MNQILKSFLFKLPGLARIKEKERNLVQRAVVIAEKEAELAQRELRFAALADGFRRRGANSIDPTPWCHPYLTEGNLRRFREFSDAMWAFAREYHSTHATPLRCAFFVNLAQNMYNWARLAQRHGAQVALFPNTMDRTALSCPEWEEFDGEYEAIMDGAGFLKMHPEIKSLVPCFRIDLDGSELYTAYQQFCEGNRLPLLRLLANATDLRHEGLFAYRSVYPYFRLAKALSEYEVIYTCSTPFAAYASGRPYCAISTGGELQFDCGRADDLGMVTHLAFNAARFLMVSNPHTLAHARRLGLTNGVYLPYAVDEDRYSPGAGFSRREWEARYGKGTFVLTVARLDREAKGYSDGMFKALVGLAKQRESLRFLFLSWGPQAAELQATIHAAGMGHRMGLLRTAGKKRLIDYYRSCDIVLDHFVYGYLGATALEAAAVGKPVIMKLRAEQYASLYAGDVVPVFKAASPDEVCDTLLRIADNDAMRLQRGRAMRDWLVRNHSHERTIPLLLALLRVAADRVRVPEDLQNPLKDPESEAERTYHTKCREAS